MLPDPQSIQIIIPILSIILLLLSFKNNIYGVISYFMVLNFKLGARYPELGAIRFELVVAIIVLISIVIKGNITKFFEDLHNNINKSVLIFFIIGMVSVPQAIDMAVSWENGGYPLFKLMLFYIMVVSSVNNLADLRKILSAIVLVTAWIAYEPIANYFKGIVSEQMYGDVAIGEYGVARGHVALANTIVQVLPIAFYLAIFEKKAITKIIYWVILFLMAIGIILSKSRGGFIGIIVATVGIIYLAENRGKAVMIAILLFVLLSPIAGGQYLDHMASIADGIFASRSSSDRYLGLVNGISMMIKRPILGVGIGCYAEARRIFFQYYFYSHNLYGELFGELGLASISWFIWIFFIFKRSSFLKKLLDRENENDDFYFHILNGIQVSLFVRLVIGNFTHGWYIWFWFVMAAMVVCIDNILKKELQVMEEEIEEPEEQIISDQPLASESESTSLN